MASEGFRPFWWMTPIQAVAALSAGINCGASGLQSPLTMPMLQLPEVPALYAGRQVRWLLHWSDRIFPKINAFGTITNLVLAITCYIKRNHDHAAAAKLPILTGAFLCNVGATAWTLAFMLPLNAGMRRTSQAVEDNQEDEKAEKEFRRLQDKWRGFAYGRAALMLASCVLGMYSIFLDGRHL